MTALRLHPDRLFPADPDARSIARRLHGEIANLPILSPHGHCDPAWFALNAPFADPAALLISPDHDLLRMLHSSGVSLGTLGVAPLDGAAFETDPRQIWRRFAERYHLLAGTPSSHTAH
jgi:glucuronate isomerase